MERSGAGPNRGLSSNPVSSCWETHATFGARVARIGCAGVGSACVRVADVGGGEFGEANPGALAGGGSQRRDGRG
jgi:hypothetical protein